MHHLLVHHVVVLVLEHLGVGVNRIRFVGLLVLVRVLEVVDVVFVEGFVHVVHVNLTVGILVQLGVGFDDHVLLLGVSGVGILGVHHLVDDLVGVEVGVLVVRGVVGKLRVRRDELLVVLLLVLPVAVIVVEDVVLGVLVPEVPLEERGARVGANRGVAVRTLRGEGASGDGEALRAVETVPAAHLLAVVQRGDNLDEVILGDGLGVLGDVQLPLRLRRARVGTHRGPAVGILAKLATRDGVALLLVKPVALADALARVFGHLGAHNLGSSVLDVSLGLDNRGRASKGAGGDGRPVMVRGRRRGSLRGRGGSLGSRVGGTRAGLVVTRPVLVGDGHVGEGHVRGRGARRHRAPLPVRRRLVDVVRGFDRLGHVEVRRDEVHGVVGDGVDVFGSVRAVRGALGPGPFFANRIRRGPVVLVILVLVRVKALLLLALDGLLGELERVRLLLCARLVLVVVGDVRGGAGGVGSNAPVVVVAIELEGFNLSLGVLPGDEGLVVRLRGLPVAVDDERVVGVDAALHKLGGGLLHRGPGLLAELEPLRERRELGHRRLVRGVHQHLAEVRHRPRARGLDANVRRDEPGAAADVEELDVAVRVLRLLPGSRYDFTARSLDAVVSVHGGDERRGGNLRRAEERGAVDAREGGGVAGRGEHGERAEGEGSLEVNLDRLVRLAGGAEALDHRGARGEDVRALFVAADDAVDDGGGRERGRGLAAGEVLVGLDAGVAARDAARVGGAGRQPARFRRRGRGPILGIDSAQRRGPRAFRGVHLGVRHRVVRGVAAHPERGEAAAPPHRSPLGAVADAKQRAVAPLVAKVKRVATLRGVARGPALLDGGLRAGGVGGEVVRGEAPGGSGDGDDVGAILGTGPDAFAAARAQSALVELAILRRAREAVRVVPLAARGLAAGLDATLEGDGALEAPHRADARGAASVGAIAGDVDAMLARARVLVHEAEALAGPRAVREDGAHRGEHVRGLRAALDVREDAGVVREYPAAAIRRREQPASVDAGAAEGLAGFAEARGSLARGEDAGRLGDGVAEGGGGRGGEGAGERGQAGHRRHRQKRRRRRGGALVARPRGELEALGEERLLLGVDDRGGDGGGAEAELALALRGVREVRGSRGCGGERHRRRSRASEGARGGGARARRGRLPTVRGGQERASGVLGVTTHGRV